MDFLKPYPRTALFLSTCALLCVLSLNLLLQDLRGIGFRMSQDDDGKVVTTTSEVRRKNSKSLLWHDLLEKNHVFHHDSILVGPKSNTTLELKSGEKVEIGEDSFFILEDANQLEQRLKRGSLVLNRNGERSLVSRNVDGTLSHKKLDVELVSPLSTATFTCTTEEKIPVPFEWKAISEETQGKALTLAISTNKAFIGENLAKRTGSEELRPGTYYWRVMDGENTLSETRSFSIVRISPLKLIYPRVQENIQRIDLNLPVSFRWSAVKALKNISREDLLQIAEDNAFIKTTVEIPISSATGQTSVRLNRAGTYFWRVVTKFNGDKEIVSEIRSFHLVQSDNLKVSLKSPSDNLFMRKPEEILFQWEDGGVEAEYEVEVMDFASKNITYSATSRGTSLVWKNPTSGNFLWRVNVKNALRQVASSDRRLLSLIDAKPIPLNSPSAMSSYTFWEHPPKVEFSWDNLSLAHEYYLEFSDTYTFKKTTYSYPITTNHISSENLKIPFGKQYWRVRALDKDKLTFNLSEVREINWNHPPRLSAPAHFEPAPHTVWDVVKEGKELVIKWDAVGEAKRYELSIQANSAAPIITQVDKPELVLTHYKAGRYKFTVSAVDVLGRSGATLGPVEITIRYSTLRAPAVEAPEVK